tara:strand:+ start:20740 stop:22647 length:1908 start_codon:yes stop_codon:yes gene_type:complete
MKIYYKDIIRHLDENPSISTLSDLLFQLGHEHSIEDDIFDIEFTPNRGDCLSAYGLARDLGVFFSFKKEFKTFKGKIDNLELDFVNETLECCPRISFLKIEIEEIPNTYKIYMENYFSKLGNKKNNFFTDISNYIAYEIGQPMHCYDQKKIKGTICLEEIKENVKFITLTDKEIELSETNYVFKQNDSVINIAGIMGGKETSCSNKTKLALVESAYFNPDAIMGKSLKYNLNSEAAYKFERGINPTTQELALRRFINIVEDHTNIKSMEIVNHNYKEFVNKQQKFDEKTISKILGVDINKEQYKNYLTGLGFECGDNIIIPSYRHDITHQNDLAEEIARLVGFDNIPANKINIKIFSDKKTKGPSNKENIKSILIQNGFSEVINQPFLNNDNTQAIKVDNPLDINKSYLRTTMRDSLVDNLMFNENRQKDSIKLFEISDMYSKNNGIKKEAKVGIIASGIVGKNYQDFSKKISKDFLKNILIKIFPLECFEVTNISRDNINSKNKNEIVFTEILISHAINNDCTESKAGLSNKEYTYNKISEYPSIYRDISFSSMDTTKIKELETVISKYDDEILKEKFIFDYYINKKSGEIKIGYRFIFQSLDKTLTDEEVEKRFLDIVKLSKDIKDISIPGLN